MGEALLGYETARANALEKLNLPSSTSSVTKSTSATTTDGKKEEKESESREEKQSSSSSSGPAYESRVKAVVAVDTLYYAKSNGILSQTIISLIGVMDFLDKNKERVVVLSSPCTRDRIRLGNVGRWSRLMLDNAKC